MTRYAEKIVITGLLFSFAVILILLVFGFVDLYINHNALKMFIAVILLMLWSKAINLVDES
jgi:hypothetical protein